VTTIQNPWPDVDDEEDFDLVARDDDALAAGVAAVLASHAITGAAVRYPDGYLPVYAAGDAVLKIFPPPYAASAEVEAGMLAAVHGRLPVATPGLRHAGEFAGWDYLLMDRLPGEPMAAVWDTLGPSARDRIAERLGAAVAALHAIPGDDGGDWHDFVDQQRDVCVARHRALGLDRAWLGQIPAFLNSVDLGAAPVLLHTELGGEHLLVADGALSGIVDFEPARPGAPEYDLCGFGIHAGDAAFAVAALRAYGRVRIDHDLSRRLLAWYLLHQYGNLAAALDRLPAPAESTLDALATAWYGI
jgi:hygromycin-B 7''-O-kinase